VKERGKGWHPQFQTESSNKGAAKILGKGGLENEKGESHRRSHYQIR
jgi:hypothetical protein